MMYPKGGRDYSCSGVDEEDKMFKAIVSKVIQTNFAVDFVLSKGQKLHFGVKSKNQLIAQQLGV